MTRLSHLIVVSGFLCLLGLPQAQAAGFPRFRHRVLDPEIGKVCYAVTLADVDGDRRIDIIAVTENRVLWYQAPDWKKRVIIEDQTERDNVCIAAADIDGDGQVDFALGAGWTKVGTIQWLSRRKSLDQKWKVHEIGREAWLHRMRFADVLGNGRPQLVISPLRRTVGEGVRLTAFEIPANPATGRWKRHLMNGGLNGMHNHWHFKVRRKDKLPVTLTASQEGISLVGYENGRWQTVKICSGMPGKTPATSGAGEVKLGKLAGGGAFIATVEPMHGTSVVVYTRPTDGKGLWGRHVIDDTLKGGHAVWTADLDRDGTDEIVIGHRQAGTGPVKGPGVYIYDAQNRSGTRWKKHVIDDGGVAVEDLIAADVTGDGRIDIVAGGRATHNLKLYVNLGQGP